MLILKAFLQKCIFFHLCFSALHGCLGVAEVLLNRCDYAVDMKDSCGTTPIMDALRAGYLDVAQLLVEKQKVGLITVSQSFTTKQEYVY